MNVRLGGLKLDFIEILKVIFLGIVEGITEWLPFAQAPTTPEESPAASA